MSASKIVLSDCKSTNSVVAKRKLIQLERVWIGIATNQWLASDFQTAFFDVEGFER